MLSAIPKNFVQIDWPAKEVTSRNMFPRETRKMEIKEKQMNAGMNGRKMNNYRNACLCHTIDFHCPSLRGTVLAQAYKTIPCLRERGIVHYLSPPLPAAWATGFSRTFLFGGEGGLFLLLQNVLQPLKILATFNYLCLSYLQLYHVLYPVGTVVAAF